MINFKTKKPSQNEKAELYFFSDYFNCIFATIGK